MSALTEFEEKFSKPQSKWTLAQWRSVALDLAARIDLKPSPTATKRGRPSSAVAANSAAVNYEALAWQVNQRIQEHAAAEKVLGIKAAVKQIMLESAASNVYRPQRVEGKLGTTYTEVRKIISKWKTQKAEK